MVQMPPASETSEFLSGGRKSTKLPVFVDWIADPVDPWVIADGSMGWIDQNHLKVLVSRVLKFQQGVLKHCLKDKGKHYTLADYKSKTIDC